MSIRPLFAQRDGSDHSGADLERSSATVQTSHPRAKALAATDREHRKTRILWLVILAVAFATLMVSKVSAQQGNFQYDSIPMPEALADEKVVKRVESAAKSFATTGSGNPSMPKGYFGVYIPAKITAPDGVKHISELIGQTTNLLSRAQRSNKPQVANALTIYIFTGMKKVAEGNYHPAARINAALVLGRLDSQIADNSTRRPPRPYAKSLPILMALYEDESNVDGVRAAALHGMHRHVSYGFPYMSADDKSKISALMTGLLEEPAPEGRAADAHAYLQRFAVDIADTLRAQGDKNLGTKLISISTEPSNPDLIALYSASRLAKMGAELKGQVAEPDAVLGSWSQRILSAFEGELARLDALERVPPARSQPAKPESLLEKKKTQTTARAGMGGGMDMGMGMDDQMEMEMGDYDMMGGQDMEMDMGMDMGMMMMMGPGAVVAENPQPPEVIASRQKLNTVLQQVNLGVTGQPAAGLPTRNPGGILASVADDKKAVVEDWVNAMQPVIDGLNDKTLDDRKKFREGLVAQIEVLREIVGVEADGAAEPMEAELPDELTPVDPLAELQPADDASNALVSP